MAKILKDYFPDVKIAFLGRAYTKPVIEACTYVDQFIDITDFLKNEILIDNKNPEAIIHVFPVASLPDSPWFALSIFGCQKPLMYSPALAE